MISFISRVTPAFSSLRFFFLGGSSLRVSRGGIIASFCERCPTVALELFLRGLSFSTLSFISSCFSSSSSFSLSLSFRDSLSFLTSSFDHIWDLRDFFFLPVSGPPVFCSVFDLFLEEGGGGGGSDDGGCND